MIESLPSRITVVEVGPRDGLQNIAETLDVATKIAFVHALGAAGLPVIEVGAFVSPKAVPQMADTAAVFAGLERTPGVRYAALAPNERGLEAALAADVDEVSVFTAASEAFNQQNINAGIDESLARFAPVITAALAAGVRVRGYVSTAFGCPYAGEVAPEAVARVTAALFDLEVDEVSVGDTIGVATPNQIEDVVGPLLHTFSPDTIALHLHDTRGTALANVLRALELGIQIFDASAGGLGGCPFAPGAAGNLATEDLVYLLQGMGIETGIDLARLAEASRIIERALGRPLPSRTLRALS
jgi:hydroxymethylglutaryl-CoA lyase